MKKVLIALAVLEFLAMVVIYLAQTGKL